MPNRYNWIQRRSRNAAGSSTDSSPTLHSTVINTEATDIFDVSAALIRPSQSERNDNSENTREESLSPTYLTTSNRYAGTSQKSPLISKHRRRNGDEDEEGSSLYFISEPSLSEDCRSLETSNSPTNDIYMTHIDDGGVMIRPYFSPMRIVHRKSAPSHESPDESTNDSLQGSADDILPMRLKIHSIPSSVFERPSSSSDDELERVALHDHCGDMGSMDIHGDSVEKRSSSSTKRSQQQMQRWPLTKGGAVDHAKILRPSVLRKEFPEQNPSRDSMDTNTVTSNPFKPTNSSSLNHPFEGDTRTETLISSKGDLDHQLNDRTLLNMDSTSSISSQDSSCSRSSSPFSWISGKKKLNHLEKSINDAVIPKKDTILSDDGGLSPDKNTSNEKCSQIPRQSTVGNFSMFETGVSENEAKNFPTFICPRCNTRQREFFTVASVPGQFESPAGYLAVYFAIYVIASLYIFGLEEGWPALDCVYFSVITLTTTGLGDYVPTSDGAKIVCSIFIYFGVACIGLLLGSLLASGLDESSRRMARETLINNCPKCVRKESNRMQSILQDSLSEGGGDKRRDLKTSFNGKLSAIKESISEQRARQSASSTFIHNAHEDNTIKTKPATIKQDSILSCYSYGSQNTSASMQSSPTISSTGSHARFMNRQLRTRHNSIDLHSVGNAIEEFFVSARKSILPSNKVDSSFTSSSWQYGSTSKDDESSGPIDDEEDECCDSSDYGSTSSEEDAPYNISGVKTAKYVFLTLKQAVTNSVLIIAIGSLGFYYIERMTAVNAFYFTTVLLTTVGYGDIVPQSSEGKLFATVYVLVAGTILLRNMSMISMIPLELRKRRLERAVLRQFGDKMDEAALRELTNGPLVRRLQISEDRPDGLKQCTREMFALAMLIRLGKITEQDVRSTFTAFRRLDLDNDGRLTSKEIILSAVEEERKRSKTRDDVNKSFTSNSAEKRSFLKSSITSQGNSSMDPRVVKVDAALGERAVLLPRQESSQQKDNGKGQRERCVHGSSTDYGCSGNHETLDIEAGTNASSGRSRLFSPIATG